MVSTSSSFVSLSSEARNPCTAGCPQSLTPEGKNVSFVQRFRQKLSGQVSGVVDEVQNLRLARETDLIQEISVDPASMMDLADGMDNLCSDVPPCGGGLKSRGAELHVASPLLLRLCGILPWTGVVPRPNLPGEKGRRPWGALSALYRCAILALAVAAVAACVANLAAVAVEAEACSESLCLRFQQLADLLVAAGSLLGFVSLRDLPSLNLLGNTQAILVGYARRQRLLEAWSQVSRRQSAFLVLVWCLVVVARALAPMPEHGAAKLTFVDQLRRGISVAAFAFASGLFVMLTHCLLHVVSLLTMMVDAFCFHFVQRPHLDDSVRDWNILQAVLRRASGAVERAFLVLQTTTLAAVLVGIAAMALSAAQPRLQASLLMAVLLLAAIDLRLFFKAAEVTEKCTRVPSLINSLSFGLEVDHSRHYLVEYVTYSAAGFYVQEVRLTAAMALKLAYVSGLVAFAVLTKLASAM